MLCLPVPGAWGGLERFAVKRAIILGSLVLMASLALPAQGPPAGTRGPRLTQGGRQNGPRMHGPGPHVGDWLRQHQSLTPEQQQKDLQNDPNFQRLTPEQQQRLKDRLQHFSNLPAERQQQILQRMETWEHLSPDQRAQARSVFQDFRSLPPDRRQAFNQAFRNLHGLSPDEQQKMIDSPAFRNQFNDHERDMLRTLAPLRVMPGAPAEPQPNQPQREPLDF